MKYHYAYRITNKELNRHYYGVRTSKVEPNLDLGVKYFSSSSDKEFIQNQKENQNNYKYKIIKIFNSRNEAMKLEIKLHNKLNVGVNKSFYNKSKQTSSGFDMSGRKHTKKTKIKMSKNKKLFHPMLGRTGNKSPIYGIKKPKGMGQKLSESIRGDNHWNYGKTTSKETKEKISKSSKGLRTGKLNTSAKMINIYNSCNKLMFKCNGTFSKTCKDNNLPLSALTKSYKNDSCVYHNMKINNKTRIINDFGIDYWNRYYGWYATIA